MRITYCSLVLLLVTSVAGASPQDTRDVDFLIERAWSQWARPADTDEIAAVDRCLVPHVLHRAATERGRHNTVWRSALLYDALNRRSAALHDLLMEHATTTENPWTGLGLARLSHDQLAAVINLLNHDDTEVAERADEALGDVALQAPALAARMAAEHRGRLVGVLQAEHRRFPESVAALLAVATPPAVEAIPAVVAGMAHDDRLVRRRALSAFVILGIPSVEPVAALATILREEDGWHGRAWDAVTLVGERLGEAVMRETGAGSPEAQRMLRRIASCLGVCDVFPVAYWTDLLADPDPAVSASALRVLLRFGASHGVLIEHVRVRLRRYVEAEKDTTLDGAPWLVGVMDACARFRGAGASLEPELRAAMRQSPPLGPEAARFAALAALPAALSLALITGDVADAMRAVLQALARGSLDIHDSYDSVVSLGPAVTPYLLQALTTEGGDRHAGAAEMLGRISPTLQGVPEALVAALGRQTDRRVQTALSNIGHAAAPAVIIAVGNPNPTIRAHAAETLGMMHPKLWGTGYPMHGHLYRLLYDVEFGVSAAALRALLASGANARDALGPMLLSDDVATRRHAARRFGTLAHADPPGTRDLLISALDDTDDIVRAAAAKALGDLRPTAVKAVPRLKEMLGDDAPIPRAYAARALWYLGAPAEDMVDPLVMAAADGDGLVRVFAAGALGTIPTRDEDRIKAWT